MTGARPEYTTLLELLRSRAAHQPDRVAYRFLADGETESDCVSWNALGRRSRAVAAFVQRHCGLGDRVLLALPSGLEFIAAFLGAQLAGAIAVPAPLPLHRRGWPRFVTLAGDARPSIALTLGSFLERARELWLASGGSPELAWFRIDDALECEASEWPSIDTDAGAIAFLQYTSGSTAAPRGVIVTHANLLHNERMIQRLFGQSADSVVVGWLPMHHDMGLIGNVLQPLFSGSTCILMPPSVFLQRPIVWLETISRYRATTSGGPDFAYELCASRVQAEQLERLDLSSWSVAFNGSEPVRHQTIERFSRVFEPCGFQREAFHPCYGLAEATLLVSGKSGAVPPVTRAADRQILVSSGIVPESLNVRIVDPATQAQLPAGCVGEIWIAGPSVASGYWNRPDNTKEVFENRLSGSEERFLRTGDLGFIEDGELFVTGRIKDLIIVRGRNHYPQDIEKTVEECSQGLLAGGGAAFAVEVDAGERLVVVHEVQRHSVRRDLSGVMTQIRSAVAAAHEIQPYAVVLIRPGTLPKTTSGKVQRRACAKMFLDGTLAVVASSVAGEAAVPPRRPALPRESLLSGTDAIREKILREHLCAVIAWFARTDEAAIQLDAPLTAFGLDSLSALEVKHALESDLGVDIPLTELLQCESIAELSEQILARLAATPTHLETLVAGPAEGGPLPLSEGQRSLWFVHQLSPSSAAYHVSFAVRADTSLDPDALEYALVRLGERHDMLRSRFERQDGEPIRIVDPDGRVGFSREDARRWSEAELHLRLQEWIEQPFDLASGPLIRTVLFQQHNGWVILLVAHHIIVDFWSLVVLMEELGDLYAARRRGVDAGFSPLSANYADFVRWQSRLLASLDGERLAERWKDRLAEAPRVLELPTDFPRPSVQTYRGSKVNFSVPEETTRLLKVLTRSHQTTLFTVLLSAFGALLSRWSGQEEVVIGAPAAGRTHTDFEKVVGYFVNLVPLRLSFRDPGSFKQVVRDASAMVLEAIALQDYPFPRIVERLQPVRNPDRSPIFQTVFVLEKPHRLAQEGIAGLALGRGGDRIQLGELQLESVELPHHSAQFDLTLMMFEAGDRLEGAFEYNADLFRAETIERMARQFVALLRSIVQEPGRRVDELSLMDEDERREVLFDWNATERPYPREKTLGELFREQVESRGDAIALELGEQRLSFRELGERASAVAATLRGMGVGPEVRVGIALGRSVELIVATVGVIEAGGAYVPLDPGYPAERLRYMIEDSGVEVILTDHAGAKWLPSTAARLLLIEEIGKAAEEVPTASVGPESLAYVIYTSGSTGRPKGVMVEHRPIVRLTKNNPFVHLGPDAVMLQYAPATFDAATFEIWGSLLNGARLVIAPPGTLSLEELGAVIRERQITTLWLTAGLYHLIVDERLDDLRGVRELLAGGEALSADHVKRLLTRAPGVTLINGYGPTEGTTFTCCRPIVSAGEIGETVPIGRPIANTKAYVLDHNLSPVPVGVAGELYIGGDGLARGYVGTPRLTAEQFFPNPFGTGRLYRTGDRVRWTTRGELEFLGRLDEQLKVRGFRVEPSEIESALREHELVGDAVIIGRKPQVGGTTALLGYITRRNGADAPAPGEVREYLRGRLPEHMVPSRILVLDALPLTPNGKIDRKALPALELVTERTAAAIAPRDDLEQLIAATCREVLGVATLSIHDNFFDLGAHSLLITKIHARLQPNLDRELSLVDFFTYPTVATLARFLSSTQEQTSLRKSYERAAARRQAWIRGQRMQSERQGELE